jgi:hypothetical protein
VVELLKLLLQMIVLLLVLFQIVHIAFQLVYNELFLVGFDAQRSIELYEKILTDMNPAIGNYKDKIIRNTKYGLINYNSKMAER